MLLSSPTLLDTADSRLRGTLSLNDQSAYFIGYPWNWSGLPITRVSTTPARTRYPGVPVMLCTCCASLSCCASIVTAVSCCCKRAFSCWMATAICSCSSGVDMVVYARGATRRAYSLQVPALDPSCDRGSRPATTLPLDTLLTSVPWSSHRSTRLP